MSKSRKKAEEQTQGNGPASAGEAEAGGAAAEAAADSQATRPEPDLAQQLAEAQARAEENWNQYLRAAAELENLRRRSQREVEQAHKFAIERFATALLDVKDSLEMGLEAAREAKAEEVIAKLREGKEMTLKQLAAVFERFGLEEINPQGQAFDPESHEAMAMQPSDQHPPNTVITVVQKGYRLNGRLLRPARVLVAKAPE